jgi:nitrogen fixation protein NifB
LSTNGLTLDERAQDVHDVGVETITVTVNALDPEVVSKIIRFARKNGQTLRGVDAAKVLTESQLTGISRMIALGATVKVNTVLVPGINDAEVARVAEKVARLGAQFINVIPLIPQHQLRDLRAPSCDELAQVRDDAERFLKVFRGCGQCRADACGIPGGKDLGRELFGGEAPHTFSHG